MNYFNIVKTKQLREFQKHTLEIAKDFVSFLGFKRAGILVVISALSALSSAAGVLSFLPVIQTIFKSSKNFQIQGWEVTPYNLIFFIVAVYVLKTVLNSTQAFYNAKCNGLYMNEIRSRLLKKYLHNSYQLIPNSLENFTFISGLIPRIDSYYWALVQMITRIILIIPILIYLSVQFPVYVIYLVLIGGLWILIQAPLLILSRRYSKLFVTTQKQHQGLSIDRVTNSDLFAIHKTGYILDEKNELLSKENVKSCSLTGLYKQLSSTSHELILLFIVLALIIGISSYEVKLGAIASFGFLVSRTIALFSEITSFLSNLADQQPYVEQINNFVSSTLIKMPPLANTGECIEFKNIEFRDFVVSKSSGEELFSPKSIFIEKGDVILLKGKNGSGKTSFLRGFCNLVNYKGAVSINGAPTDTSRANPLKMSYAPQFSNLLNIKVIDNILSGSGKGKDDLFKLTSHMGINLDLNLLNRQISNNGRELSGGQAQLISLLRAFIRDYDILILDEYKNHLSLELCDKTDAYLKTLRDKTIFIISHEQNILANKVIEFP